MVRFLLHKKFMLLVQRQQELESPLQLALLAFLLQLLWALEFPLPS